MGPDPLVEISDRPIPEEPMVRTDLTPTILAFAHEDIIFTVHHHEPRDVRVVRPR